MPKINSNAVAGRWLKAIGLLLVGIPLLGWLGERGARLFFPTFAWPAGWIYGALFPGGACLLLAGGLLAVEWIQDAGIERQYRRRLVQSRVRLPSGLYECQACGYAKVTETERRCPLCGNSWSESGSGRGSIYKGEL
jgi:hypothetical protein